MNDFFSTDHHNSLALKWIRARKKLCPSLRVVQSSELGMRGTIIEHKLNVKNAHVAALSITSCTKWRKLRGWVSVSLLCCDECYLTKVISHEEQIGFKVVKSSTNNTVEYYESHPNENYGHFKVFWLFFSNTIFHFAAPARTKIQWWPAVYVAMNWKCERSSRVSCMHMCLVCMEGTGRIVGMAHTWSKKPLCTWSCCFNIHLSKLYNTEKSRDCLIIWLPPDITLS